MAEFIQKTDTLNQGREKLNAAITDAEKAKTDAGSAVSTSNQAKQIAQTAENKADSVQAQFDQVVIEGDSSVEAAQARVDVEGTVHSTLKARLDAEHTKVTAQLAERVTQTDFDSWVATLLDGGPSIFYETLAALQADYPNGTSGVALVRETDPARIYVWDGTKWADYGAYQGIEVKNNTISEEKTTFISVSTNKLNIDTLTYNKTIDSTTGQLKDSTTMSATDFIEVEPSRHYTFYGIDALGYYDENKAFITYGTLYSIDEAVSKQMGLTTRYVRLAVYNQSIPTAQMNKGEVLLPYEPYGNKLNNRIKVSKVEEGSIKKESIADKAVTPVKTSFIVVPKNLLNANSLIQGFTINASTGEPVSSTSNSVSDFIEVKPQTDYIGNHARFALYDANKKFILSAVTAGFKTTSNTYFVRVVVHQSVTKPQLNEGTSLLPYEEWHKPRLSEDIEVPGSGGGGDETGTDVKNDDYFVVSGKLDGYYVQSTLPARGGGIPAQTANGYLDSHMESFPHYISKTQIKTSVLGQPIYRYDLIPNIVGEPNPVTKFPKIFITCGTHGTERMSPEVVNHFVSALCNNWKSNELLETLRWNIHFIIIPMVNPDGWDASTRQNANGVDINRQFPVEWVQGTPGTSTYGGTAPLTEPEALAIKSVFDNEKDIIYMCDFHNFSSTDFFVWNAGGTVFNNNLGKNLVSTLGRKWKQNYEWLPQDETTVLGYASWTPGGSIARYASSLGIQSSTFETGMSLTYDPEGVAYSSNVMTLSTEAFINWLILNVRNNIPIINK